MIRHAKYGLNGNLTLEGIADARKKGRELEDSFKPFDVLAYSNDVPRVFQSVENALIGMNRPQVITITDLLGKRGIYSEEFKRLYKQDRSKVADIYLQGKLSLPNQATPEQLARGVAQLILDQLKLGNPETAFLNGINQLPSEALFLKLSGIQRLSEIGGPLDYLETMVFDCPKDGEKVECSFRGKNYVVHIRNLRRIAEHG